MKKRVLGVLLALLTAVSLTACDSSAYPEKLVVTYVKSPLNVPSMVEREEGTFAETFAGHGIEVEYANITNGAEQTQALASGDVQFLFAVGAPSVILSAANGGDIRIIGAYSTQPKAYQILTGEDEILSASDLAGKTVAGPKGTTLNELLVAYLRESGVSVDEVDYLAMSIGDAQAALEAGRVDAALLAGVNAYRAGESGYRVLTDGEGLIDGLVLVACAGTFAEQYPELVEEFLAAHRAVIDAVNEDPEWARQIAAEETGLDLQAVETMYSYYDFHTELTASDMASLEKTVAFMVESGMIREKIAVDDIVWKGYRHHRVGIISN